MSAIDVNITDLIKTDWFGSLLMKFIPSDADIEGSTPEEMVRSASWKAFSVSTLSAIPPGALGWLTVLPELIAVTKLQMNLVFKIAKFYGQEEKLNTTMVAMIFANDVGIEMGKNMVRKIVTEEAMLKLGVKAGEAGLKLAEKQIIKKLSDEALSQIMKKISRKLAERLTAKALARWVVILSAPIFGYISKNMTERIGKTAISHFSKEIEFE